MAIWHAVKLPNVNSSPLTLIMFRASVLIGIYRPHSADAWSSDHLAVFELWNEKFWEILAVIG